MATPGWRTALAIASRRSKFVVKLLLRRLFQIMSHVGLHVTPVHYYSAIPDVLRLAKTTPQWNRPSTMPGIQIDLDAQLAACERICRPFANEFGAPSPPPDVGPGFGHIEAQALRAVVRHLKPRTIVEIGSGVSTYCMLQALASNASPASVRCIDPHPRGALASPSRDVRLEIDTRRAEIVFCLSQLHYERPDGLQAVFPDYDPQPNVGGLVAADAKPFKQDKRHFPSSIYIRTR